MPKISVLLTSYNHAGFIRQAIDSVLQQTFTDFELLILDDASTDDSWWIIKSYDDPRIKAIRNKKKGEITFKVIDVISNVATGEYIAVHHSDDLWEPRKLEQQVAYLDSHSEVGAVFTDAAAISEDNLLVEGHFYSNIFTQPNRTRHQWLRHFFSDGNALCHPSILIRRKCFEECGFYRPWLWQIDDFDMWIRLLLKYEIHILPEKLTRFRVRNNEANVSGNYRSARIRNFYERHRVLDNYKALTNFEDLCKVFPEARKYYREEQTDVLFALGRVALEISTDPFTQLFALNLIQETLVDPIRAASVRSFYDFDIGGLVEFTGRYDVFSMEELSEVGKLAAQRAQEIGELQARISAEAETLANLGRGVSERDELILGLDGKLSASQQAVAELTLQIEGRHAELRASNEQVAQLTKAVAEVGAQAAEKDSRVDALERQTRTLQQQAVQREDAAAVLQQQLAERGAEVQALRSTKSWQLTRPLRLFGKLARGAKRVLLRRPPASHLPPSQASPAEGHLLSRMQFDAAFYLQTYPDVAAAGGDPYRHFVEYGAAEGRLGVRPPGTEPTPAAGVRIADTALEASPLADPDFDESYYLQRYPDVREAGMSPLEHFRRHGRKEGRIGKRPELKIQSGMHAANPAWRSVLVVSHDASRTGAPILALNIMSELQKRFNVTVLLLGGGELIPDFCEAATTLVGPQGVRGAPRDADDVIATLCAHTRFDFAIVNSIESHLVLRGLAWASVPSVNLVHEFAAYTRPRDAFPFAMHWAGETVFSTRITYENAISELPALAHTRPHILPQGRCMPPAIEISPARHATESERIKNLLRPEALKAPYPFLIIGAGSVQYRKGVDLFMECAARVIRSPGGNACRFVWIGGGYDPEKDIGYSSYLAEQVRRSDFGDQFAFMPETPLIDEAYPLADMLLLTSRLDPLPNVAIDAMSHGLPVICFSGASGIADILEKNGLTGPCVAPYHDTAAMAELVLKLADSTQATRELGARVKQVAEVQFDMTAYIGRLEQLAADAQRRMVNEAESARVISASKLLQPDFFLRAPHESRNLDDIVRHGYVRAWAAGLDRRKPVPGFHPHIYREAQQAAETNALDPFAAYLQAGQPAGPWSSALISSRDPVLTPPGDLRVALHLHVYYPDMLADMLERLGRNRACPDLFISVPDELVAQSVRAQVRDDGVRRVQVRVVPNVGRDIAPLLTAFGAHLVENYDIVGHVHTKKSADIADAATGSAWHRFLMENLLGGKAPMADVVLGRMASDASIGLVFPDDPHFVDWGTNRPHAETLAARLGLGELPKHPVFPVGSMFWARADTLRPLVDLKLVWSDYPSEPLPYDGSMLHAIERLLPLVAGKQSARIVLTHVDGITR